MWEAFTRRADEQLLAELVTYVNFTLPLSVFMVARSAWGRVGTIKGMSASSIGVEGLFGGGFWSYPTHFIEGNH